MNLPTRPKHYGAAVFVSHDRGEVFRLTDTVAVMHKGIITALDSKENLFNHPKTLAAAILIGIRAQDLIIDDSGIELEVTRRVDDLNCKVAIVAYGSPACRRRKSPAYVSYHSRGF